MHKPLFCLAACAGLLAARALQDVVPHDRDYFTADVRNCELIYTEKDLPFAKEAAAVEAGLQPRYEATYGYRMDETLYVGLISDYNQIANGFSTPYPNNRQINYGGGVLNVDYFCSSSWLKTLLYHETAHNYPTKPAFWNSPNPLAQWALLSYRLEALIKFCRKQVYLLQRFPNIPAFQK